MQRPRPPIRLRTSLLVMVGCTTAAPSSPDGAIIVPLDGGAADATELADAGADADPGAPDATPDLPDAAVTGVPPELDGRITINELMTYNAVTILDDAGIASDWVELYNPTSEDLPLAGYTLTDDLAIPVRAVIPDGVVLPAGGHLVLWLDHAPERGPLHLGFHLARESGDLSLNRPDGTPIDRVRYGKQAVDFSAAREPDGSTNWKIEWHASPGAPNPGGPGTPAPLENPVALPELIPAAGDLTERLLGYDVLLDVGITISAADMASLLDDPAQDVPGTLTIEGRSYGPVGVRLKGQNSFEPITAKPSLRINIDEYVPRAELFGLKDLTLNNMNNDLTMMHERIAYLVARQAGIPASRANHARVTINGVRYGLYVNVETVKHKLLTRWFTNAGGSLFEGTDVDFLPAHVAAYEHEAGSSSRALLTSLAAALQNADADAAIAAAGSYASIARFQDYWAMAIVIGQFDSMPYSNPGDDYLVYVDQATGKLTFLPWGMDETFYNASRDPTQIQSVLAVKCKASAACWQGVVDRAWALLSQTESLDLEDEVVDVAAQIHAEVALDTRKWYTTQQVYDHQGTMRTFVSGRRAKLATFLPPPTP